MPETANCRVCGGEDDLLELAVGTVCENCLGRGLEILTEDTEEDEGPWRFTVGQKGINRVTVWENTQTQTDNLYVTWRDQHGKRRRKVLETEDGKPVTDRELAKSIAEAMSQRQRARKGAPSGSVREVLGLPNPHTLEALYDELFAARASAWSKKHRAGQERMKTFWLGKLGKATLLTSVSPAQVERKANEGAAERDWAPTTKHHYLRHIKDVFLFAEHKLNWISSEENLSAVDLPKTDPQGDAYSDEETARLIVAGMRYDLRMAGILSICQGTARRINPVRQLETSAYRTITVNGVKVGVLDFPGATDKAGKTSSTVLTPIATEIVERLLEKPAVKATGYLFPAGDLESDHPVNALTGEPSPLPDGTARDWLHKIEKLAGVEWVKGRAFHGIKRMSVTIVGDETGDMGGIAQQAGTSVETLIRIYRQHSLKARLKAVQALAASFDEQLQKPSLRIVK